MSQYSRTTTENSHDLKRHRPQRQGKRNSKTTYTDMPSAIRVIVWLNGQKGSKTYQPFDENKVIGYQLFDYQKDPEERHNVANDPAYAGVVKKSQEAAPRILCQKLFLSDERAYRPLRRREVRAGRQSALVATWSP